MTKRVVLAYSLLHKSGGAVAGEYPLPRDGSPQAIGSALTYARRYALCAVTGVAPGGSDDDGAAAEAYARRPQPQPEQPDPAVADLNDAKAHVRTAWEKHRGDWDTPTATTEYAVWSSGELIDDATPTQLRDFAAYLTETPTEQLPTGTDDDGEGETG